MNRFGVKAALLILPALLVMGSFIFCFAPLLWVGSLLSISDNALHYSVNQSAKESLYVPLPTNQKYGTKGLVDILITRTAKAIALGACLLLSVLFVQFDSIRYLSLVVAPLCAIWIYLAKYAGNKFKVACLWESHETLSQKNQPQPS